MNAVVYRYGDEVFSKASVRLIPRSVGDPSTTLWELDEAQRLPDSPADIQQFLVRFHDENERPTGALTVISPRPTLDYQANTEADGSGVDVTSRVNIVLRRVDFSAALLEVRNLSRRPAFILAGMQLRGTPLHTGDPMIVEHISYASRVFYSPRTLSFDLPLLDSIEQADSLARFEMSRRKSPRGDIHQITLTNQSHASQILTHSLFDLITVRETQTAHDADYFIIAEAHEVDQGGHRHRVTWTLESAAANAFWVLDRDRLNQSTTLAY